MLSGESQLTVTGDLRLVAAKVHGSIHEAKVGSPMEHVQVYRDTPLQDLWHNCQHVCEPRENKMITLREPKVTTTDRGFSSEAPPLPAEMSLNGAWTLNNLHEAIKNHTSVGYCGVCECVRQGSGECVSVPSLWNTWWASPHTSNHPDQYSITIRGFPGYRWKKPGLDSEQLKNNKN